VNLDDTLNSSAISLGPVAVVAQFAELETDYGSWSGATESIRQVGQQIGPNGFTVEHSFDDGLPDPVTATGQNDASGSLSMDLVGRPSLLADAAKLTWNAGTTSGSGTGTTITTTLPGDLAFWDYVIVAVTVASDTLITETSVAADSFFTWKLLGDVSDGGAVHTYVFGKKFSTAGALTQTIPAVFKLDASAGYAWVVGSIDCGRSASAGVLVPITPGDVEVKAETASVTAHAATAVTVANRGWTVGVFGAPSTAGVWTSAGNTVVVQASGGGVSAALVRSPLRTTPGAYALSASTASATAVAAMVHIAFEVRDRPAMDAVSYFSTFNPDSPIYGFDRDTAAMQAYVRHLDRTGGSYILSQIFEGQMAAIGISERTATLDAVSRTRLLLDDSHTLPTIYGWREGCTTDWLAGWLLAQGGQYIGVPPSKYTRWWAPQYGSMHPYMDGSASYDECTEWDTSRVDRYRTGAQDTTGPFASAMFAQQTNKTVTELRGTSDRNWATEVPGIQNPVMADLFSKKNSKGQFTMWIRTDPFVVNPAAVTSGSPNDTLLYTMSIWHNHLNTVLPGIRVNINADGSFNVWLGTQTSNLVFSPGVVGDGNWHFMGYYWDYANATGLFRWDDTIWNPINGNSNLDVLPNDDATMTALGGYNAVNYVSHLPVADMQLETGINDLSRFRPNPTPGATFRPTHQPLIAIANPTPVQGWTTLQSLAQSTLAHLRVNESDDAEFVPLDYFGETAQMTVTTLNVLDTDFNAGDLALIDDPTQTRNVVTVQYTDTTVGSQRVPILEMNTSFAVPRGVTYATFALDVQTVETHGAAAWWTATPVFQKLTAAQVAGSTAIQNENVMSVNTLPDGTGTVFVSTAFTARIYDWDSTSITVQFTNTYSQTLYLANNGTQIPFLRALGYAISTNDGYSTVRDDGSIGSRRERALTTEVDWVQDRTTAQELASTMVTLLARPRPQITVTVQGDPRRKPGDLCQLVDSTGMKADGHWRINKVTHTANGPQYTQTVDLVRVGETANWDEGTWDDSVWGV
jgi:hypothetical protein